MQAGPRKNIYAISEVVPDTDDRNLQQFITHSKWSAREVLDHVARDADELIGDATQGALIIDESGFAKQDLFCFRISGLLHAKCAGFGKRLGKEKQCAGR